MPLQETSGTASFDAFGGGAAAIPTYIEDVFSTWLYTGNGSTQTITNGIDLAGKGGLVWLKCRNSPENNEVYDTVRGANQRLITNTTGAQVDRASSMAFSSTGLSWVGSNISNTSGNTYASWTFRKQPKFFDVVTYTGTGSAQNIAHNLGSVPGLIIVKGVSGDFSTGNWAVYHRSLTATTAIQLNNTNAAFTTSSYWNNTEPTSTRFTVGTAAQTGAANTTYVAYLFAHNAGGFGLTGTDNVISCGSFTKDGSGNADVTLGYEPQWILVKTTNGSTNVGDNWLMADNMRGANYSNTPYLYANGSNAEMTNGGPWFVPTATGFQIRGLSGASNHIYIAIRRGPMKTPTTGTSVFTPVTYTGNGTSQSLTAGFPIDLSLFKYRGGATNSFEWFDRLRGTSPDLRSAYTFAELATTTEVTSFASNTQVTVGASSDTGGTNVSGQTYVLEAFRRAPGFFDEVCYTGTGTSSNNVSHNLGVVPELMIVKERNFGGTNWRTYSAALGNNKEVYVNLTNASTTTTSWANTTPTSTVFTVGSSGGAGPNDSGSIYVAYLFASCPGVSKVTNFTGNGTTQTINCGFTGGARFVMIKATSTTGNWLVFDTARGMTTSTDPWLALNSTAAESATTGACTTVSSGFAVDESKLTGVNTNGVSYIALAIA